MMGMAGSMTAVMARPVGGLRGQAARRRSGVSRRMAARSGVKVGDALPEVTLYEGTVQFQKATEVSTAELGRGKALVIAVPGAFTPGCSQQHLPGFMGAMDELKALGFDTVACVATNDPHVMEAWGRDTGAAAKGVRMLSDKEAELAKALGMDSPEAAMTRTKRYTMAVENGKVAALFLPVDPATGAKNNEFTYAAHVLAQLKAM